MTAIAKAAHVWDREEHEHYVESITALGNLVTACFGCNRSKCDKLLSEWRRTA